MKTLTLTQSFHCRPSDVFRVLMDEKSEQRRALDNRLSHLHLGAPHPGHAGERRKERALVVHRTHVAEGESKAHGRKIATRGAEG